MDASDPRRLRAYQVYRKLLELEPEERSIRLADSDEDPEVEAMIARLLSTEPPADFLSPGPRFLQAPVLRAGDIVGNYEIVRFLDEGGMGYVYQAEQRGTHRTVALKTIAPHRLSPATLQRFRVEAEIMGRLEHPNIARVYEAGEMTTEAGVRIPFMAMEYVKGALPLNRYVEEHGMDLRARLELFACACGAVEHGHRHGVIHRDLKPSNLLVHGNGSLKVIDFGIGALAEPDRTRLTATGQILGTLPYMAPERLEEGFGDRDCSTDTYSLGVVLYELLTGTLPYPLEGKSFLEAARILARHSPSRPSQVAAGVPRDLDWVVLRAMSYERSRRHPSVGSLGEAVGRFLEGGSAGDRPPSALYRLRWFLVRNRNAMLVITAGCFAVAALSALAWFRIWTSLKFEVPEDRANLDRLMNERAGLIPGRTHEQDFLAWARRANDLVSKLPAYEERVADGTGGPSGDASATSAATADLVRLSHDLRRLAAWVRTSEESWSEWTEDYSWRSLDSGHANERWEAFRSSVLSGESPSYGVEHAIPPQAGLLPVRRNPGTGLWEFAFLPTGTPLEFDGVHSSPAAETGLTFILLPGGRVSVGANEGGLGVQPIDTPAHSILIGEPFFVSKYEMTHAQWERIAGYDPSGTSGSAERAQLPVVEITRDECRRVLASVGLDLPTEAQWEYAAQGGRPREWPWPWGPDEPEWDSVGNFGAGKSRCRVGLYSENGFGLHDVVGNVGEWCREEFLVPYAETGLVREHDGLRSGPRPLEHPYHWAVRGYGGAGFPLEVARVYSPTYKRFHTSSRDFESPVTGVRPVRRVEY